MITSKKEIELNYKDSDGMSALLVAALSNSVEITEYLLSLPGIEYKDLLQRKKDLSSSSLRAFQFEEIDKLREDFLSVDIKYITTDHV